MIRQSSVLLLALATLTIGGCEQETRPCPGFGTPLADKWSTALLVGEEVTYDSNTGSTISLELRERVDSEPYTGSSNTGSSEIVCGSESERRYHFNISDVVLRMELSQTHFEDPAQASGESFSLQVVPESPAGVPVGFNYLFFLGEQARLKYPAEYDSDGDTEEASPQAGRFIENIQIGNDSYTYAIEQKFEDLTPLTNAVTDPNSLAAITRLILAEDGGLVQFELLNGDIYSRR